MAGTYTTNQQLYKPAVDEEGWDTLINSNFDLIDALYYGGPRFFVWKSGSLYKVLDNTTKKTVYSDADAGVVSNQACTALTTGGGVEYEGGTTFNCQTGISVPTSVTLQSGDIIGEGSNGPIIKATASLSGAPLVKLNGSGAGITQLIVNAQNYGTEAIQINAAGCGVRDIYAKGGTARTLGLNSGMARSRISHVRLAGDNYPTTAVFETYSTDHIIHDVVATGVANSAPAMIINGNSGAFTGMHLTSNSTGAEPLRILGDNNVLGSVILDTVPSAAEAALLCKGSRNIVSMHCLNVVSGQTKAAIALRKTNAGSTVYGNIFNVTMIDGAQNQNWTGVVRFLTENGNDASNLTNFRGTRITFAAGSTNRIIGSSPYYSNIVVANTDNCDFVGFVSSGTSAPEGVSVRSV